MKKLGFLIFILSIIFIPKNINALSFTANNDCEYEVSDSETLRDYFYFTNIYNNNNVSYPFFSIYNNLNSNLYGVLYRNYSSSSMYLYKQSYFGYSGSHCNSSNTAPTYLTPTSITCFDSNFNEITCTNVNSKGFNVSNWSPVFYNTNITYCPDTSQNVSANFTEQDILDKYSNLSCGSPSPSPEPEEPEESEVSDMFELCIVMLQRFVSIMPVLIVVYLIFDITGSILFGKR